MTARADENGLHWGFSTLGCAELNLPEVCQVAAQTQFRELEIRALEGRVDLPQYAVERSWNPRDVGALFQQNEVRLTVAASDFKLVGSGGEPRRAEFARFCAWAESWRARYVRVFGGGVWGHPLTESDFQEAADNVAWWRGKKRTHSWQLELLLETHDAFSASDPCCRLMKRLDKPIGLIWDSHHTWRLGGETPRETWNHLGSWIRHVHVKDSVAKPSARHPYTYVLPGEGEAPLAGIIDLLHEQNFSGAVSLEWERLWHPYLPPLTTALARLRQQPWFKPQDSVTF